MFHDINFFPVSDQFICSQIDKLHTPAKQPDLLKDSLLTLTDSSRQFTLKVGWQPAHDPEGSFHVQVIQHKHWRNTARWALHGEMDDVHWDVVLFSRSTVKSEEARQFVLEANNLVKLLITPYKEWTRMNRTVDLTPLPYIWCLVGNVVEERFYGEAKEIRRGTKKFSPNTKVCCFPTLWGDGYDQIKVIARPRFSQKYIQSIISSKHVTNWRMQKVYTPFIIKKMLENNGWTATDKSREEILQMLEWLAGSTENGA